MKKIPCALALSAALLFTHTVSAREAPLIHPPAVAFVHAGSDHLEQNRKRIAAAAKSLGWVVQKDENHSMLLSYDKAGKHQVSVRIDYSAQDFTIHYLDSHNLNYAERNGTPHIHPNYNRWIRNLIKQIGDFSAL